MKIYDYDDQVGAEASDQEYEKYGGGQFGARASVPTFDPTSAHVLEAAAAAARRRGCGGLARAWVLCPKTDRRDENGHVADSRPQSLIRTVR
jgi:hypothetical protein